MKNALEVLACIAVYGVIWWQWPRIMRLLARFDRK